MPAARVESLSISLSGTASRLPRGSLAVMLVLGRLAIDGGLYRKRDSNAVVSHAALCAEKTAFCLSAERPAFESRRRRASRRAFAAGSFLSSRSDRQWRCIETHADVKG